MGYSKFNLNRPIIIRVGDESGGVEQGVVSTDQGLSAISVMVVCGGHPQLIQIPDVKRDQNKYFQSIGTN